MAFDRTEVDKIAHLARLHIDDAEADEVAARIADILELINRMQSVDTVAVEPLAYPHAISQRLRADQVTETDRREELQLLAPAVDCGLFLVPKVIE